MALGESFNLSGSQCCIIDKITEEALALFTDFSEPLDLSMKDRAVPLGTESPTAGHLQADRHIQASTLTGML